MNPKSDKSTFLKFRFVAQEKILFWFLLALIVKSCFFFYKVDELKALVNPHFEASIAREAGDTFTYLQPVENLLKLGHYEDDFRMPGYAWIYYLLRLFLSIPAALNTLVFLQLFFGAASVYYLARLAAIVFKQSSYFYWTFFLYLFSTFVSLYDPILLTESFATAALIFAIYFICKPAAGLRDYFFSGLFLTWCIFLKPVFAPLLLLYAAYLLFSKEQKSFQFSKRQFFKVLLFILPFLFFDGIWTARNYSKHKGFYPLTTSLYFKSTSQTYLGSLIEFVQAYGGSIVWWEPGAAITYFKPLPANIQKRIEVVPPVNIYTTAFTKDSLELVKNRIAIIDAAQTDSLQRLQLTMKVKEQLNRYTASIKTEHPILYFLSARLKICKTFFLHSGTYNLFYKSSNQLNLIQYAAKVFYSLLYLSVVALGITGLILMLIQFRHSADFLFTALLGIYAGFSIPILLRFDEYRYFVTAYPLFLIAAIFASMSIFGIFKNKIFKHA